MKDKVIFIYVTTADENEAKKITRLLLQKKLIACANFFPIICMYTWNEKIQENKEWALILKSVEKNYARIILEIGQVHSYEVPCICNVEVAANTLFSQWVKKMVGS